MSRKSTASPRATQDSTTPALTLPAPPSRPPAASMSRLAPGARRDIEAAGGRLGGAGKVKAGVVLSWVALGLAVLFLLISLLTRTSSGLSPQ